MTFLEPAGADRRAEAEVVRTGGSVGVVRTEVESETPDSDPATVSLARAPTGRTRARG